MGDKVPLRWIEDAEAKQVIAAALFEQTARRSWCQAGRDAVADRLARIGAWLAPGERTRWPLLQAQSALVRVEVRRQRQARRDWDEEGYRCNW